MLTQWVGISTGMRRCYPRGLRWLAWKTTRTFASTRSTAASSSSRIISRRLHEHVGLGPLPDRPAPLDHELEAVRGLLSSGREHEALQLHRDITGQGEEESREALRSLSAGF